MSKTLDNYKILDVLREILIDLRIAAPEADFSALPLLGHGGVMDSLTAMRLIERVEHHFNVDILGDLNLDCMETTNSLAAFIAANIPGCEHKEGIIGQHLLIDCSYCPLPLLNGAEAVRGLVRQLAAAIGARILKEEYHAFSPAGVTGFAIVSASHIAIHTWPEYGYMGIDIFSCRNIRQEEAEAVIKAYGRGIHCHSRLLERRAD